MTEEHTKPRQQKDSASSTHAPKQEVDRVVNDVKALGRGVANKVSETKSLVAESAREIGSEAKTLAHTELEWARAQVKDQTARLEDSASAALARSKVKIAAKPLQSLGIALLAGFILGRITSHR